MNKKRVISYLAAIFMVAACAHGPQQQRDSSPLLRTVPSDALVVMDFDHCSDIFSYLVDSTSTMAKLSFGQLGDAHCVLSYVYTGQMEPILAIDTGKAPADTTDSITELLAQAPGLGLKAEFFPDGWADGERSAIIITHASATEPSVLRHIAGMTSIYEADSFRDALMAAGSGKGTIYLRNSGLDKTVPKTFLQEYVVRNQLIGFLKKSADWTVMDVTPSKPLGINTVLGPSMEHYTNLFSSIPMGESKLGGVLPSDAEFAVSQPLTEGFRAQYESYVDACVKLTKYNKRIAELKAASGKSPLVWEKEQAIQEVAYVCWNGSRYVLARSAKAMENTAVCENAYAGFMSALYGELFAVPDSFVAVKDSWMIFGEEDSVRDFIDCDGILEEDQWQYKSCHFVVYRPDRRLSWDPKGIRYGVQTSE